MNRLLLRYSSVVGLSCGAALSSGCARPASTDRAVVVFNAGALALPLRQALDSFGMVNAVATSQENAGSVETVRKILDLHRVPDVVALADTALFSRFLSGRIAGPVAMLGRTRLVLAYTSRSRYADQINTRNWPEITTRPGVQIGRSDPALDPAGYRALMAMQLAERYYRQPGLARRLERAAATSNMRPKSADLVALLQTGNLDYAWEYESVARRLGLRFVSLPPEVNLGDPSLARIYATAKVEIPTPGSATDAAGGEERRAPQVMTGAPIVFGAAVLRDAPHREIGHQFITYIMSPAGRAIFTAYGLQADTQIVGSDTR